MLLEPLEPRILLSAIGDMDNNGLVNQADAALIAQHVVHLLPTTAADIAQGDLSGNGKLDGFDSSLALSLAVYDGHSLTISGVVNVWAPNPTDFGSMWMPTAGLWGANGVPDLNAIHQGQLADCYLLAGIGAVALQHPERLLTLIVQTGSDVAVTWKTTQGVPLTVHMFVGLSRQWQVNNGDDTYWEYFEKAYADFRTWNNQIFGQPHVNTMASTEWGDVSTVMIQLWDVPITEPSYGNAHQTLVMISDELAGDHPLTFQSKSNAPTMIPSHVWVVTAVDVNAGLVFLRNPWGLNETRTIDDLLANALPTWAFVAGA